VASFVRNITEQKHNELARVDQVLVNLCVNSRDAIDGIGRISRATTNIPIQQHHNLTKSALLPAGDYVRLSVMDITENPGDIHLLLRDVIMPDMNGWDLLCRTKRAAPRHQAVVYVWRYRRHHYPLGRDGRGS
jgi:CheY-like chemotaxis protein